MAFPIISMGRRKSLGQGRGVVKEDLKCRYHNPPQSHLVWEGQAGGHVVRWATLPILRTAWMV